MFCKLKKKKVQILSEYIYIFKLFISKNKIFDHKNLWYYKMSATTQSSSTEVCDGDNLAIILVLYWVVYLIINALIFAAAMYALRKCFDKIKFPGGNSKNKEEF